MQDNYAIQANCHQEMQYSWKFKFKFMPLNLLHLLWPSTMGENVCDWWCDTRVEFTLFLVSQKYIVLTMGTKLCRMFKDA